MIALGDLVQSHVASVLLATHVSSTIMAGRLYPDEYEQQIYLSAAGDVLETISLALGVPVE